MNRVNCDETMEFHDDDPPNEFAQSLLIVHQEKWQKQLLERYGNTLCLLDATYKTMKYELALFFLCVRTNVGYSVVAEFILQEETAEKIAEALEIIKQWNPTWNPDFFMTDYSEAELIAIEQVFPNTKCFLCDFHREQAWERWVRDHKHGLTKDQGDELLRLLRACASEVAPDPSLGHAVDHSFQQRVADLKASPIWKIQTVAQWFSTTWLCCAEVSNTECVTCSLFTSQSRYYVISYYFRDGPEPTETESTMQLCIQIMGWRPKISC